MVNIKKFSKRIQIRCLNEKKIFRRFKRSNFKESITEQISIYIYSV